MPVFEEDPALLSKARLRSDLVAHNVALPTESSRKEVYVGLHVKHIDPKHAADFSSDEEDQVVVSCAHQNCFMVLVYCNVNPVYSRLLRPSMLSFIHQLCAIYPDWLN